MLLTKPCKPPECETVRRTGPCFISSEQALKALSRKGGRAFGMRRSRYVGLAKTHLQHVFIATAMNLFRIVNWLNEVPLAQTRRAAFERLVPPAIA